MRRKHSRELQHMSSRDSRIGTDDEDVTAGLRLVIQNWLQETRIKPARLGSMERLLITADKSSIAWLYDRWLQGPLIMLDASETTIKACSFPVPLQAVQNWHVSPLRLVSLAKEWLALLCCSTQPDVSGLTNSDEGTISQAYLVCSPPQFHSPASVLVYQMIPVFAEL